MDKRKKIIHISLWTLVILCILLFTVLIIVEHSQSKTAGSILQTTILPKHLYTIL